MKAHALLCFLVLAGLNTGCSFFHYAAINMIESPWKDLQECRALNHYKKLAQEAWKHVKELDDHPYSEDYVCGFISGYVDYLDAGGNGEPPAMPPDCYQSFKYKSPLGQKAILDWFAGFRHGAGMARESGQRELIVLPLGLAPKSSDNVASETATQPAARVPGFNYEAPEPTNPPPARLPQQSVVPPPEEVLPQPRFFPQGQPGMILFTAPGSSK